MGKRKVTALRHTLEIIKPLTSAQGEVIYAANMLHEAFFRIFLTTLSMERRMEGKKECYSLAPILYYGHALAIWHMIKSDAGQRDMAFAALSTLPTLAKISRIIKQVKWAKDIALLLADYRNLLAHSPIRFRFEGDELIPAFIGYGLNYASARKFSHIRGVGFWRTIRNDLLELSFFVDALSRCLTDTDAEHAGEKVCASRALPRRPRLRSVPHLRAIKRLLNPQQVAKIKSKRRVRRRASPAGP